MVASQIATPMAQVLHALNSKVAEPFRNPANRKRINPRWLNAVCRLVDVFGGDSSLIREWAEGEEVRAMLEAHEPVLPRQAPVTSRYNHAVDDRGLVINFMIGTTPLPTSESELG